jgi:hypothetical protein
MEGQKFYFKVKPDDDSGDIQFLMGVDHHSFETYITGWSNSWECISEKLEEYLHTGKTAVELDLDTEPTCLSLKKKGDYVLLNITPSGFTKERPFRGLCSEKDVLCKLYNGLLYAMTFRYDDIGCGWNWDDCKMVCYNRMKSRTIEEFLLLGTFQRVSPFVVKHVLVYDGKKLLHICDETIGYYIPIEDKFKVYDKNGKVIAIIDGTAIRTGQYTKVVDSLPVDFDLWAIQEDGDGYLEPHLIERTNNTLQAEIFDKSQYNVNEIGQDPYDFTSETLWTACNSLDSQKVAHFLGLHADTTYVVKWLLNSNEGGTTDSVGNPTYEESEESIRKRDELKASILRYVIDNTPNLQLKEEHLSQCIWHYCPACLKLFLEYGANPNEQEYDSGWCPIAVRYRSVLSIAKDAIKDKEDKYGIISEMKAALEAYGAKDVVIWNEEYPSVQSYKEEEYES